MLDYRNLRSPVLSMGRDERRDQGSLPLGQRTLMFERFVQQRLDIGLVRQALGFGESLRQCDVGLWQPDR